MSSFLLRANEILALLIFSHLNVMASELAVALLCPPLLPLVSICWVASIVIFWDELKAVSQRGEQDIQSYENGDISIFSAIWSTVAAGFSMSLWIPSVNIFDVLTSRESPSTLIPSFWSNPAQEEDHLPACAYTQGNN